MITQVRPLRPEYTAASLRHLWGVVLPGPNQPRGLTTARRHYTGGANVSRLQRPFEHAMRLIPTARLVTVLTREAADAACDELAALPGINRCVVSLAKMRLTCVLSMHSGIVT